MTQDPPPPRWLEDRLPPFRRCFCRGEIDFYGISTVIADRLGRRRPPYSRGHWKHGWPFGEIRTPYQLAQYGSQDDLQLTATTAHRDCLVAHGYREVEAVGMPFVYAPATGPGPERRPGSLLVMPAHTTPTIRPQGWDEQAYVDAILPLRDRFDEIVVCAHSSCFRTGFWVDRFRAAGVPCISGARMSDANAICRMRALFSSFEFVTGNLLGSFVPYAAYCGAKVSVYAQVPPFTLADYANEPVLQRLPELADALVKNWDPGYLQGLFPWLYCEPADAVEMSAWAAGELGADNRRPDAEIADLLGWNDRRLQRHYLFRVLPKIALERSRHHLRRVTGR